MKSYYDSHELAYQQIKKNGYLGWGNAKSLNELSDLATLKYLELTALRYFPEAKNKTALDLGCGTGPTTFVLSRLGFDVVGIDISVTAIAMAKDLALQLDLLIDFRVQDLLEIKDLNKSFDLVYDSHCLHCIVLEEDRKKVFTGIKNCLKKKRYLFLIRWLWFLIFILQKMMKVFELMNSIYFGTRQTIYLCVELKSLRTSIGVRKDEFILVRELSRKFKKIIL